MANDDSNKSTASSKLGGLEPLSKGPTKAPEVSEIELGVDQAESAPARKPGESVDESNESEAAPEVKNNPDALPRINDPGPGRIFLVSDARPKSAELGKVKQVSGRKSESSSRNGKRFSTGPKTDRGKSNSRRNSLKHGMLARAIPLRNLPFYNPKDELEVRKLLRDLWMGYNPQGRSEEILVEEIARAHVQLSRLCRAQTAGARIAMEKEFRVPSVEEKSLETHFVGAEESREELFQILKLAEDVTRTNDSIPWGLMARICRSISNREKCVALQRLLKIINARAANLGASASERDRELREEFLETLATAAFEEFDAIDAKLMGREALAKARFEQHLLPDEETLRNQDRHQSTIYRELHRSMEQLERMQARRRANEYRDSDQRDDSLPDEGEIAA